MKALLAPILCALAVAGCEPRTRDSEKAPSPRRPTQEASTFRPVPEITSASESTDFIDLVFSIQEVVDGSTGTVITASGLHHGARVGLKVIVAKGMKPGFTGNKIDRTAFRTGGIMLESLGPQSDAFVAALAALYKVPSNGKMRRSVEFVAFPLEGNPAAIMTQHLNFKVFHDSDNATNEYCELYVHVDAPKGVVRLDEKDAEYRKALVKALSSATK